MNATRGLTDFATKLLPALWLVLALAGCGRQAEGPPAASRDSGRDSAVGPGATGAQDTAAAASVARIASLTDAVRRTPADPKLRIALARAELAAGSAAAAEGSLHRARELGAGAHDVIVPLAASLLAQRKYQDVLDLVGDPAAQPEPLRLPLAALVAETELRLPDSNRSAVLRRYVEVLRMRAALGAAAAASDDIRELDARLAALRASDTIIADAASHLSCSPAPDPLPLPSTASLAGTPAAEGRRLLQVGPTRELRRPSDAARVARDGDIVEIDAGRYVGDVAVWLQHGLLLRGVGGHAQLDSQGRTALDQGIWVIRGRDITVENVGFTGARSRDRNGSGIRFSGRNLTVRNCVFRDNENGILTWKDPASDVLVEHSVFAHNGYGDGQSHNIYIGHQRSFTLRFSHSHDSHVGHEVKSRAGVNRILYNRITDEDNGDSSYLIDLPEGGDAYIVGNEFLKGLRAENPNAISYAAERPDVATGSLWVASNSLYNRYIYATFVRNRSRRPALLVNNVIAGVPIAMKGGPAETRANFEIEGHGLRDPARLDFTLLPDSPLIDAGVDPGAAGEVSLWPQFEYVHPAGGRPRRRVAALDIGAHEFCGW